MVTATEMMKQTHPFKYFENEISQWLELPYRDSPFSMVLVLPRKPFELKPVQDKLSASYVKETLAQLKEERVEVVLPKFKIHQKVSLRGDLSFAGYGKLFNPGEWKLLSKNLEFRLGDVIQATTLEVDEQGTTASAATALTMESTSLDLGAKKSFYCDQPFLFLLMNRESGEIYFMGKLYQPE
jgi:serpin B